MSEHEFAFLNKASFLGVAENISAKPYAVAGVAYDGAVTNRPGARFGPHAIRRASHMLCDGIHPLWNCSPISHLTDVGDLALPNTSLVAMREKLQPLALEFIRKQHMCWLGGDHSITLPLLRAYRQHFGRPLALIHFDAHCDTWRDHFGEPSGHGTWTYEAIQEGLVIPEATIQIGIRSAGAREAREYVKHRGGEIFTAHQLRGLENRTQLASQLDAIRERIRAAGSPPTYLTLDIDCLDPAFAPGTGTPEPAGMTTSQVATFLEELSDLPFVGMDCVEVAPAYDHAELTTNAAAFFVWTYLCGRIARGKA
jgi:agmatinase